MACKQQNVMVSEKEIDAEIARAASLMVKPLPDGSPDVKAWLKMVTKKQGVSVEVYRRDAVWPSVALRKLVGEKVHDHRGRPAEGLRGELRPARALPGDRDEQPPQGPAGVGNGPQDARSLENFGELAAKYSIEGSSRALQGEVPPIRKHGGQPLLEKEAFALKPGELSGVIQVDDKYVILFCEGYTKPAEVEFAKVRRPDLRGHPRQEAAAGDGRLLRAAAGHGHGRQLPDRREPLADTSRRPAAATIRRRPPRGRGLRCGSGGQGAEVRGQRSGARVRNQGAGVRGQI